MPFVEIDQKTLPLEEGESVLDGLLRHGQSIPHGCKAGACQSCLMRLEGGELPSTAQVGLKPAQKELGHFLSCCCVPEGDLRISHVDQAGLKATAKVLSVKLLGTDVLRVRLSPVFSFKAGQYLNIWHGTDTVRSYSIASLPSDEFIELHIRILANGLFSRWALDSLKEGDTLQVQGPLGHCIYSGENPDSPLLLAGIGTGAAPLYGIVRDALEQGHQAPIHLFVGARHASDLYLLPALTALAEQHSQLTLRLVAQNNGSATKLIIEGDIYREVKSTHANTQDYQVYLCGAESFVRKMKKQCFLAGASMQAIHSDAFLPCS